MMTEVLRLEEFDIVAAAREGCHRIAKIRFGRDGSIYVIFPGFEKTEGLVAKVTAKAGMASMSIGLPEYGKVAGHLVKYSHHPDGRANFSQTGKVRTEIFRQSIPLNKQQAHLFTIQLDDLGGFESLSQTSKTPQLNLLVKGNVHSLKILGRWYKLSNLHFPGLVQNPRASVGIIFPDGKQVVGWVVAPPSNTPYADFALFLVPQEIPQMASDEGPCLVFLGGFDSGNVALDLSKDTEFLCLKYPCSNPQELRKTIGSVDL